MVQLIGVPFDKKSSFLSGAAEGPDAIRKVLHDGSSSYVTEMGFDMENVMIDHGNIAVDLFEDISPAIASTLSPEQPVIFLGGDHSISFPLVENMHKAWGEFDVLHFDAHTDLYDEFENDRFSHACPFARIMEKKYANRLVQVGIRSMNAHQKEQAERFGVEIIPMRKIEHLKDLRFERNLYISIDLDGFDPAFAPGVSHYEPGGLVPRDVINFIQDLDVRIIGADIVELNPSRDHHGMTAVLAARLLREICGKMASF